MEKAKIEFLAGIPFCETVAASEWIATGTLTLIEKVSGGELNCEVKIDRVLKGDLSDQTCRIRVYSRHPSGQLRGMAYLGESELKLGKKVIAFKVVRHEYASPYVGPETHLENSKRLPELEQLMSIYQDPVARLYETEYMSTAVFFIRKCLEQGEKINLTEKDLQYVRTLAEPSESDHSNNRTVRETSWNALHILMYVHDTSSAALDLYAKIGTKGYWWENAVLALTKLGTPTASRIAIEQSKIEAAAGIKKTPSENTRLDDLISLLGELADDSCRACLLELLEMDPHPDFAEHIIFALEEICNKNSEKTVWQNKIIPSLLVFLDKTKSDDYDGKIIEIMIKTMGKENTRRFLIDFGNQGHPFIKKIAEQYHDYLTTK